MGYRLAFLIDIRALLNVNIEITATWPYFTDFFQFVMNCEQ